MRFVWLRWRRWAGRAHRIICPRCGCLVRAEWDGSFSRRIRINICQRLKTPSHVCVTTTTNKNKTQKKSPIETDHRRISSFYARKPLRLLLLLLNGPVRAIMRLDWVLFNISCGCFIRFIWCATRLTQCDRTTKGLLCDSWLYEYAILRSDKVNPRVLPLFLLFFDRMHDLALNGQSPRAAEVSSQHDVLSCFVWTYTFLLFAISSKVLLCQTHTHIYIH